MKASRTILMVAILLALALVACERPLREGAAGSTAPESALPAEPAGPENAPAGSPVQPEVAPTAETMETESTPATGEAAAAPEGAGDTAGAGEAAPAEGGGENAGTAETPAETTTPAGDVIYQVKAGDTLVKIAERYNVSVNDIAVANNLANINLLDVGQELLIPVSGGAASSGGSGETVYIVRAGDTLFRIALNHGLTVEELAAYNNIVDINRIDVGQEIRIPAKP